MAAPATSTQSLLEGDDRLGIRKAVVDSGMVTVEMCPAGFGLMLNVSERGLAVYTLKSLISGQTVQVSFLIPGSSKRIECIGQVKWAVESHAGLSLSQLDSRSSSALRNWLVTMPETSVPDSPHLLRRKFPVRDEQLRVIQRHISDEGLSLDDSLQFILTRLLELADANGGAIAIGEAHDMVCRASAGLAPEVGTRISSTSGITSECIRTTRTIYCEDTEQDSRVDRDACRELNLRSLLILPVMHQQKVAGVMEAFSPRPAAFRDDHYWLAERLTELIAQLAYASESPRVSVAPQIEEAVSTRTIPTKAAPVPSQPTETAGVGSAHSAIPDAPVTKQIPRNPLANVSRPSLGSVTRLRIAAVIAVLLVAAIVFAVRHFSKPSSQLSAASVPTPTVTALAPAPSDVDEAKPVQEKSRARYVQPTKARHHVSAPSERSPEIADQLIVLPRADKAPDASAVQPAPAPTVQFRPASNLQGLVIPTATTIPELARTAVVTGGAPLRRVQPRYPSLAMERHIEGDVVLQAHIRKNGTVGRVRQVKGDPLLAEAAREAVKQWRYQPMRQGDTPIETDITVTIQFRLATR